MQMNEYVAQREALCCTTNRNGTFMNASVTLPRACLTYLSLILDWGHGALVAPVDRRGQVGDSDGGLGLLFSSGSATRRLGIAHVAGQLARQFEIGELRHLHPPRGGRVRIVALDARQVGRKVRGTQRALGGSRIRLAEFGLEALKRVAGNARARGGRDRRECGDGEQAGQHFRLMV